MYTVHSFSSLSALYSVRSIRLSPPKTLESNFSAPSRARLVREVLHEPGVDPLHRPYQCASLHAVGGGSGVASRDLFAIRRFASLSHGPRVDATEGWSRSQSGEPLCMHLPSYCWLGSRPATERPLPAVFDRRRGHSNWISQSTGSRSRLRSHARPWRMLTRSFYCLLTGCAAPSISLSQRRPASNPISPFADVLASGEV